MKRIRQTLRSATVDQIQTADAGFAIMPAVDDAVWEWDGLANSTTGLIAGPVATGLLGLPTLTESTDISANTSTTAILAINSSASGRVAALGDHDWYNVTLQAGHTYSFAAIGTGLSALNDVYLNLRNNSGTIIASDNDSGPGQSAVIGSAISSSGVFTASTTGTYFIDVGARNDGSIGQYGVSVTESSSSNGYKPDYDLYMGAGALHADPSSGAPLDWNQVAGTTRGQGVALTYSFRSSLTYTNADSGSFSQCTTAEMDAVAKILGLFSDVCNVTFTRVAPTGYSNSAQLVIANYYDPGSAAGAYAYYPTSSAWGGDLWLNTAAVNPNSIVQGQYSWFAIAHEFGHALGLSHPGDYNAGAGSPTYSNSAQFIEDTQQYTLMSYWAGSNSGQSPGYFSTAFTLLMLDIYELQTLYGVNTTTRSGDTVYGFNNTAGTSYTFTSGVVPYYCIWDGAGTDKIDASGYSQAQTISLVAGSFSNVGGGTGNISIALGATVENATGGSGADRLIGNASANILDGGTGNDTLTGGAGNDTLTGGAGTDYAVYSLARSAYTVTYNATTGVCMVSGSEGTDTLSTIEFLRFSDGDISVTSAGDTTAPLLSSVNPADNTTGVAVSANFVLTFNESVQAGSGNIVIYTAAGSAVQTIAATDTSQVTYSGSTVTINPANNLVGGTTYYLNVANGAITDLSGNAFAGISDSTTYNFTTLADTTAPLLTSLSPADNTSGVAIGSNLVLTFSEAVKAGSGNIIIYNSAGTAIKTIAVTDTSQVTFSGNTVTVDPTTDLSFSTGYYVNLASGVIKDLAGNNYAGISGATTYNFTTGSDTIAPLLTGTTPADDASNVAVNANLVLTFNENVKAGTGSIIIYNQNGTVAKTIGVTDTTQVAVSGNTVTINPSTDFLYGGNYYVNLVSGVIKDTAGNSFVGLSGSTAFNFAAAPDTVAPLLASVVPADNTTGIALGANLVFTFNEAVKAGTGNILIKNADGTTAKMIAVTDTAQVTFAGNVMTVNPSTDLASGSSYYVNMDAGVVDDLSGNDFGGLFGSTTYNFSTLVDTTAPTLLTMNPADNSRSVAPNANLVLSFSESVVAGTGNILIYTSTGTLWKTIAASDTSQVTFSGNTVTINPDTDFSGAVSYYVNIAAGVIKDGAGNSFAGIAGSTTYNFLTAADTTAPLLASTTPSDNATGVSTSANLVITFNESIKAGSGNIVIYNGDGTIAKTISITDTSQIAISGNTLTINPSSDFAGGANYYVNMATGVIKDIAGNSYAGIAGTTAYNFSTLSGDTTAPTLVTLSPSDNATGVSVGSNIAITFNEAVQAGSGNILIYNGDGTVAKTIAVTDTSQVSFSGSTATINPTSDLATNSNYYVNIGSGVITDTAGNAFSGITGSTAYNFSTQASSNSVFITSGGLTLHLTYNTAAMAASSAFRAEIEKAAQMIADVITDPITVNLTVDISGTGGGAYAGPSSGHYVAYSSVRNYLNANAASGDTEFQYLPATSSIQGQSSVAVWATQEKLFGLLSATDSVTADGTVHFAGDISTNAIIGVALHEITHAMGRVPYGPAPDIFDLSRFTSVGARLFDGNIPASASSYFSQNGGTTKQADYGINSDPSDFLNSGVQGGTDPFNEYYSPGYTTQALTTADLNQMAALGFHLKTGTSFIAPLITSDLATVTNNAMFAGITGSLVGILADGETGQDFTFQTLYGYDKGAPTIGDQIMFHDPLFIAESIRGTGILNQDGRTGTVEFRETNPTTIADAAARIASYFAAGIDEAGEMAFFKVQGSDDYKLFVSDGLSGLTELDAVVDLVGVTSIAKIDLTGGYLTIVA